MPIEFRNCDLICANAEKVTNILEYVAGPVVGPIRILAGKVQIIAGAAIASGALAAYLFTDNEDNLKLALQGWGLVSHGSANMIRGAIASTWILGGLFFLLIYDLGFQCRFHYSAEPMSDGSFTLNPFHPELKKDAQRFVFA